MRFRLFQHCFQLISEVQVNFQPATWVHHHISYQFFGNICSLLLKLGIFPVFFKDELAGAIRFSGC